MQQVSRSEEAGIESDDAVVDEAEEAVGVASSEVDKAEDADEAETAEESAEKVAIAQSAKESAAARLRSAMPKARCPPTSARRTRS